jgi:hypothetical protein
MAGTDWINQLDEEQIANARLIAAEAKKAGVPPNFAVALAFQESNLRHAKGDKITTSEKNALGLMQLLPDTAKDLGVDPADLHENIRGGVTYLRQMLDKYENDRMLAAAAYNHGASGSFFKGGKLPEETKDFIRKIDGYGGFQEVETTENVADRQGKPASEIVSLSGTGYGDVGQGLITAAGGAAGAVKGSATPLISGTVAAAGEAAGKAAASQLQPAATQAGMPPAQGAVTRTPVGGKGTFNYAKQFGLSDFDAARAADMSKKPGGAWDVARQVAEANAKIGPGWTSQPQRADLFLPDRVGGGPRIAGELGTKQVRPVIPTKTTPFAPLEYFKGAMQRHPVATSVVGSTLGGLGAGFMGVEALDRYQQGDIPGAALAGTGFLSGLGSFIAPRALGAVSGPIGLGATAGLSLYDLAKLVQENRLKGEEWVKENPPTRAEMEAAQRAYYGPSR